MNVSKMCIDEQPQEEQSSSFMEGNTNNNKRKLVNNDEYEYQQQYQLQHRYLKSQQDCNDSDNETTISDHLFKQLTEKCNFVYQQIGKYRQDPLRESERMQIIDQVFFAAEDMLKDLDKIRKQDDNNLQDDSSSVINESTTTNEKYKMIRQARNLQRTAQPKYKRRSRAMMVGHRCHSCNTTETPEWRRGPDGARTLCNACGLHYSKLLKRGSLTIQTHNYMDSPPPPSAPSNQNDTKAIGWS